MAFREKVSSFFKAYYNLIALDTVKYRQVVTITAISVSAHAADDALPIENKFVRYGAAGVCGMLGGVTWPIFGPPILMMGAYHKYREWSSGGAPVK